MTKLAVATLLAAALLPACKGEKKPSKATETGVSAPADHVAPSAPKAEKVEAEPSNPPHPDLVAICDASNKQLAEGGLEVHLGIFLSDVPVTDSEIKKGVEAVGSAEGEMFQALMKQIAKEAGYPDWDCPALWELAKTAP